LIRAIDRTSLARELFGALDPGASGGTPMGTAPWEGKGLLAREPRQRAVLIVKLAAELYRREHGRFPATAAALVGPFLKFLPDGIQRDAPIPERAE
jgi:hypothetical protein